MVNHIYIMLYIYMTLYHPRHLAGVFTIDFRVQAHVVVVEVCFFGSLVGPTEGWLVEIIHPSPMKPEFWTFWGPFTFGCFKKSFYRKTYDTNSNFHKNLW